MKAASIQEIKQGLTDTPQKELVQICLRLARFKKENKELMTYLLFEATDGAAYIREIKKEMEEQVAGINVSSLYYVKKSLRKILIVTGRYIRYTGSIEAEIELLLHFCRVLKASGIPFEESPVLVNMYQAQLKKIKGAIATLHEDLQYEYGREMDQFK